MDTTITITVNIAAAHKHEGDALLRITLQEKHLRYISQTRLAEDITRLYEQALSQYYERNHVACWTVTPGA